MVSADTLTAMTEGADRYLVGLARRRNPTAQAILQAARGPWQALPDGSQVCAVHLPGDPARYFVVRSPERLAYERAMRWQSMRRCRDHLQKLQQAVAAGRLRAPEKIGARAGAILKEHHGARYFAWRLDPQGRFRFWVDRAKLRAELRVEGTYLLQTNDPHLEPLQAVAAYKDLQTVERGFRWPAGPGPPVRGPLGPGAGLCPAESPPARGAAHGSGNGPRGVAPHSAGRAGTPLRFSTPDHPAYASRPSRPPRRGHPSAAAPRVA